MPRAQTTALALLAFCLLPACATRSAASPQRKELRLSGYGVPGLDVVPRNSPPSSSLSQWNEPDAEALKEAQAIEAEQALKTLWSVVSTTNALAAEWEFRFWSHGGALTLLSLGRTEEGEKLSAPISRGTFLPRLSRDLPTLLGTSSREVTLTLGRHATGWSADLDMSEEKEPPPHARTRASIRGGSSRETHRQVLDTARRLARLMSVPRGGSAGLVAQVSLEDARIQGWEPEDLDPSGDGPAVSAGEDAVNLVVAVLLPFTLGVGEQTVSISLKGEHRHGDSHPRWSVVTARILEPPPPPAEVADIHQEYRALHEYILTEFQEQTREYAVLAAGFTLEQIAYSVVGGLALKGAWVIVGKGAPTVLSSLAKGGRGAVLWFRNLLVRAPAADRELLLRLWMKAETQGLKALTEVEKQELRALMARLEKVLETPLDGNAKNKLWTWSREEYFGLYNPQLANTLGENGLRTYEVHHLCPMRYVHLFPKLDISGKANLVGLHVDVHRSVSAVWLSLGRAGERMKSQDVTRLMEIINRHYSRWFHKVYNPADAAALANAQQAALGEAATLKALLAP